MAISIEQLPDDPNLLKKLILDQHARLEELEELVRFFKARQFASKSEVIHPGQGTLFNEVEDLYKETPEEEKPVKGHTRKRPKRKPLPAALPREEVIHDLEATLKVCPCGSCLFKIGEEVSEQLDIEPAKFKVIRNIRPKYACRTCSEVVRIAPLPKQIIPKSYASPGLLAYITTSKYVDGLPLNRIEKVFSRLDCSIPRSTLSQWMIKASEAITPLINLLHEEVLVGPTVHIDETHVQVLKEKGRSPTSKSYMWVMARGDPGKKVVLFHYAPSRASEVPKRLLDGYRGNVISDGYEGYGFLRDDPEVVHCGCWDHCRRLFHDVVKGRKKGAKKGLADEALEWINSLYEIERRAKGTSKKRRNILRNIYSVNIIRYLERWADTYRDQVAPKSLLGKAIRYMTNQWPKLTKFLDDPTIPFTNSLAENAIRPFAVGRRAWLFSDTQRGAEASAALYSLIETAKANGVEPYEYLRFVFSRIPLATTLEDVQVLLPWNFK